MKDGRLKFDPKIYEDLETVQERSIGSEMTYKNSLVETDTGKTTMKNGNMSNSDDVKGVKKQYFLKTANFGSEKGLLHTGIGINEERTYRDTIERLEERISSKNKLISQLKTYQIQLTEAFEKVRDENTELKDNLKAKPTYPSNSHFDKASSQKLKVNNAKKSQDYEAMAGEIEALVRMCSELKNNTNQLSSDRDFLKKKLKESKDEIDYLSNQLISGSNNINQATASHINLTLSPKSFKDSDVKRLKERVKILEKENFRLKNQTLRPPSSEFESNRTSHGPDEFSNTKSFRQKLDKSGTNKHIKFTDACSNLMISCFPSDFDHERPALKQVWRWIKGVLEDFVTLNKVFGELQEMLGANTVADVMFTVEKLTE